MYNLNVCLINSSVCVCVRVPLSMMHTHTFPFAIAELLMCVVMSVFICPNLMWWLGFSFSFNRALAVYGCIENHLRIAY